MMRFEAGLAALRRLVWCGGYVVVSEVVWLREDRPAELETFWQAYPEIDTVESKRAVATLLGYEVVGDFVLPAAVWVNSYYGPLADRVAAHSQKDTQEIGKHRQG